MSSPESSGRTRWRAFPWDENAAPGARFSPSFVAGPTGRGRFDLPRSLSPCLYLADSAEHAIAEVMQPWRGQEIGAPHLLRAGHPLALVQMSLPETLASKLVDLCNPKVLANLDVCPDRTASRHREVTQPLSRRVWEEGASGLRWWSAFWGDWHTTVLFTARAGDTVEFGQPYPLTLEHPALTKAAELLGIQIVD